MLNISEYRHGSDHLADHLPWAALVGPGVVLNKDGSFQRSFRFRGPDLESSTDNELIAACARLNNVLRRLRSGWTLFFEASRIQAPAYPASEFPDSASWLVDEERRATPKRQYYLQSAKGNRLFELGLGPVALSICGASGSADQTLINQLLAEGTNDFAARFLQARGLGWAAAMIGTLRSKEAA